MLIGRDVKLNSQHSSFQGPAYCAIRTFAQKAARDLVIILNNPAPPHTFGLGFIYKNASRSSPATGFSQEW